MYKVIHFFTDLQDNNHAYNVGDTFPRSGMKVTEARLAELAGSNNKQGKPLIGKVVIEEAVEEVEKPKPKRNTKKKTAEK